MILTPTLQLTVVFLLTTSVMVTLWFVQRRTGNAGIVDIAWAVSIGIAGVFYAATGCGDVVSRWLCGILAGLWSARLSVYLFRRVVGHPEEGRYATLRQRWAEHVQQKMFGFYLLQAIAAVFFALPFLVLSNQTNLGRGWLTVVGLIAWVVGVVGVSLSDRQLDQFRMKPSNRGLTCRVGLWNYSRHPNYFFEWVHWCSYVPLTFGAAGWWLALLVSLLLLYFLFFVTGIPPTEAQAIASRGEAYRSYQRTTSVFIPWFPKSEFTP